MIHGLETHSPELGNGVVQFPSLELALQFLVELIMAEGEEMPFGLNEGKHFDPVIDFLPGPLGVDSELKLAAVLELDEHFVDALVSGVFVELVDFAQGEEDGVVEWAQQTDLVVGHNEFYFVVLALGQLADHELVVVQDHHLSLFYFVFLEAQILKRGQVLQCGISWLGQDVPGVGDEIGNNRFLLFVLGYFLCRAEANDLTYKNPTLGSIYSLLLLFSSFDDFCLFELKNPFMLLNMLYFILLYSHSLFL